MPTGRATNDLTLDTSRRDGGGAEISLAWQASRSQKSGKTIVLAIGGAAVAGVVWMVATAIGASVQGETWMGKALSGLPLSWHVMSPASAPTASASATSPPSAPVQLRGVAEPDVPAAVTLAPIGAYTTLQQVPAAEPPTQPETQGALAILTSTAIESAEAAVGIQEQAEPETPQPAAAAARRQRPTVGARRDTSWTGSFFER